MKKVHAITMIMLLLTFAAGASFKTQPVSADEGCVTGGDHFNQGDQTPSCAVTGTGSTCGPHGIWLSGCVVN